MDDKCHFMVPNYWTSYIKIPFVMQIYAFTTLQFTSFGLNAKILRVTAMLLYIYVKVKFTNFPNLYYHTKLQDRTKNGPSVLPSYNFA
jgi:hypothetical protein